MLLLLRHSLGQKEFNYKTYTIDEIAYTVYERFNDLESDELTNHYKKNGL